MSYEVTQVNNEAIPILPDGTLYPITLVLDESTVYAETAAEAVAGLIGEDYLDGDARHRAEDRNQYLAEVIPDIQGFLTDLAMESEGFDESAFTDAELVAISPERFEDSEPVRVDFWGHDLFLIVLALDYAPYTSVPLPEGNVVALDPTSDETFVQTLHDCAHLEWFTANIRLSVTREILAAHQ
jgi:hypothetical protein